MLRILLPLCLGFSISEALLIAQPSRHLNPPALPSSAPGSGPSNTGITLNNSSGSLGLSAGVWSPVGPGPLGSSGGNVSGRITGIAVDPTNDNNIYVAAAGGGVWRSNDGGSNWTPLTDNQGVAAMGAIAIAPSSHLKIYAGTGEANNSGDSNFGLGILHSEDGGVTWALSSGPSGAFTRLAISRITVDPAIANTAYAAVNDFAENGLCCSNTGIYKTTDGGVTWNNVTAASGLDSATPWSDVVVDPNNSSIIYAAHGDIFGTAANGIYRSLDGGTTWTLLSNAPSGAGIGRIALAVAPSASASGSHVLYVAIATQVSSGNGSLLGMYVSSNSDAASPAFTLLSNTPDFLGGANGGGQGWYDIALVVDPNNAANVTASGVVSYASNSNLVIRTTNGGVTWTDITTGTNLVEPHTDSHALFVNGSGQVLLGTDGGIWSYNPANGAWTDLNGDLNTIQFTGIGLHPTNVNIAAGGSQDNGTEVYSGSITWNETDGGDGGFTLISQTNGNVFYGVHPIGSFGPTSFLQVSTNGGNTWVSATPTISNEGLFNFYPPIFADPSNGNRIFLGGDALYESTNEGSTWIAHASPDSTHPIDSIAVNPGSGTIYLATGGTFAAASSLWISNNDGATWTGINLPAGGRVNEIDIDPNDPTGATAYAVINTFNFGNGQVFKTSNSGASWLNISGNLPQIPTWSLKVDNDSKKTVYISNETGVYSATSPYTNWTAYGTGLAQAQGVNLQLNSNLHLLAVGTHGRGAWFTLTPVGPDLSVTKSHSGNFTQGDTGDTYTITVQNVGSAATNGTVTMVDGLPSALTATAFSGSGWGCSLGILLCVRNDSLAAGASYPPITVTVNVASNAPSTVTNSAYVSGGGDTYAANNSAADVTTILSSTPDLTISKSHTGNFFPGETGATYTITVSNAGAPSTSGVVTVSDILPTGLTATAMAGSGWNCTLGTLICNRSDALAGGSSYPAITLTVSVAANAPGSVTNTASVSGGGDTNPANNTASDVTTITGNPPTSSISSLFPDNAVAGGPAFELNVSGSNFVQGAAVNWNGSPLTTHFEGSFLLAADVPATLIATVGTASITVTNSGELPSTAAPFAIVNSPVVPALTAGFAEYSWYTLTGLFAFKDLFLLGSGFEVGANVFWNGTNVGQLVSGPSLTIPSSLLLTPGQAVITVTNPGGSSSAPLLLNVPALRTLSSISPSSVAAGSGNVTLTVNGSGFASGDTITVWPGSFALPATFINSTQLQATVPAAVFASNGTLQVWVNTSTSNGSFSSTNELPLTVGTGAPVLSISKSHAGNFYQGEQNAAYSVIVSNASGAGPTNSIDGGQVDALQPNGTILIQDAPSSSPSSGPVTVNEFVPVGMTLVSMAGDGWLCTLSSASCTRSDVLNGGLSYPPITVTVNVSPTAPSTLTNSVSVSGGGTAGDGTIDITIVTTASPDLTITKTHSGNFTQGQTGATYTLTAFNAGGTVTTGLVSVTDSLPAGLTATAMSGAGWLCAIGTLTCTRSDALASGGSFPAITLTVNVASNAPASVTNFANISGGGEVNTSNDQASDVTAIAALNPLTLVSMFPDTALAGGPAFTLSIGGSNFASGAVVNGNGTPLVTNFFSASFLIANVPASLIASAGTVPITVSNPGGATTNALTFHIVSSPAVPTLTGAFPTFGILATGLFSEDLVILSGSGFENGMTISWNGTNLGTYSGAVQVPFSLMQTPGLVSITATNPGGVPSQPVTFTIPPLRNVSSISPASVPAGSNAFKLTVNGTGFASGDSISVFPGSINLPTTFISSVQLQATVPAALLTTDTTAQVFVTTFTNNGVFHSTNELPLTVGAGGPVLSITKSHAGNFFQGEQNATYTVTVSNASGAGATIGAASNPVLVVGQNGSVAPLNSQSASPSNGPVTVGENVPPGMTLVSMAGNGWNCTLSSASCTRTDVLPGGSSYPPITVTVNVSNTAGSPLSNLVSVSGGGSPSSFATDITLIQAGVPAISSMFPDTATAGGPAFTLNLSGSNFASGAVVNWNGTPLITTFQSAFSLTAAVPASLIAATGTASITVTDPGGLTSSALTFHVVSSPAVPALTQAFPSYSVWANTGLFAGDLMFISGSGFELGMTISWNGTNLGPYGGFLFAVPSNLMHTPGPVSITATNPGGVPSQPVTFTIPSLRTVSSISPASVPAGSGDFTLTVNGTGFAPGDSIAVFPGTFSLPTTFVSSIELQATVPAASLTTSSTAQVWVNTFTNSGDFASINQLPLTIGTGGPVLSISKSHVGNFYQGEQNAAYTVTVSNASGAGATLGMGSTQLVIAGQNRSPVVIDSQSASPSSGPVTVTDTVPAGMTLVSMAGDGWNCTLSSASCTSSDVLAGGSSYPPITVTVNISPTAGSPLTNAVGVSGGGSPSSFASDITIIQGGLPAISSTFPDTALAGGPAFTLSVFGSNFVPGAVVNWNGTPLPTTFLDSIALTASVPGSLIATPGTASITVTDPGIPTSNPSTFNIITTPATPTLSRVFPTFGINSVGLISGHDLIVSGSGLESGVTFSWNGTNIGTVTGLGLPLVQVPDTLAEIPGPVSVVATNPGGAPSAAWNFTVPPLRTLTSISPSSVATGSGAFTLTVNGTGFAPGDAIEVRGGLNGVGLSATFISPTQLQTTVPAAALTADGTLQVFVATIGPTGAFVSGNELPFTVGIGGPVLSLTKSHVGNFYQGQQNAAYTLTVSNASAAGPTLGISTDPITVIGPNGSSTVINSQGASPSTGPVTVTESLPNGLTLVSVSGSGWNCTVSSASCTRADILAGGASYPPITVTVNVSPTAASLLTNFASVSGGGSSRQTAGDVTIVGTAQTFQTSPEGLLISVDGSTPQAAPFTIGLVPGSHTIATAAKQAGGPGTQYVFTNWSDSGSASHNITVGSAAGTYTATFKTQFQLTTAASPAAGGSVSPASGNFYDANSVVNVQASANAGYQFANFSGGLTGTTNPQGLTITGPLNLVANFTPLAPQLAASIGTRTVSGNTLQVKLTLTNTGPGTATNATITGITAITDVAGSGIVTVASGTPGNLGTIGSGSAATTTIIFNWPSSATRVSFTVNFTADGGYSGSTKVTALY